MNSEQRPEARPVACAFCGSTDTELFALFGQFLLASQYYCRRCKSVFDVVKWEDAPESGHGDALPTGHGDALSSGHGDALPTGHGDALSSGHGDALPTGHRDALPTGHRDALPTSPRPSSAPADGGG